METGTVITVTERATKALAKVDTAEKLRELAKQSAEITAVTNPASYQQLHSVRMALKNKRIEIEKVAKTAREDATKFSKAVIEQENILIGIIQPEETRLQTIQDAYDDKVALEKAAAEQKERERIERIQSTIENDIRQSVMGALNKGSVVIATILADVQAIDINEFFAEFKSDAEQAKVQAVTKLTEMHAAALDHEEEQRRIRAEREELAKLKAAEDQRQKEAAQREAEIIRKQAEEEAALRRKIAAEEQAAADRMAALARAAQAERDKADREARERLAAQEAAAKAIRDEEDKRLREEAARLATEARALEDRQRAERDAADAKMRAEREVQDAADRAAELKERQEQDAREAEQREIERQRQELMDGYGLLKEFVRKYGGRAEFKRIAATIEKFVGSNGETERKAA